MYLAGAGLEKIGSWPRKDIGYINLAADTSETAVHNYAYDLLPNSVACTRCIIPPTDHPS